MIRRILVPDQNADNFLKLYHSESPCCGDSGTICQYDLTYTQANTVSLLNITEDGVARALTCVPATTSAADVQAAILAALIAAGYEDDGDPNFEGVTVVDNGSTLTVTITGDVVAVSLTTSGGAATFNQDCTLVNLCTFATTEDEPYAGGTTGSAETTLKINGVNYDIGTVTPGTTSAATVKAAIEADMATAGVSGTATVTTNGSGGTQTYNISIAGSEWENEFILSGFRFVKSGCAQSFV